MTKKINTYSLSHVDEFKNQLIDFLRGFSCFCFLDSNLQSDNDSFDFLAAFSHKKEFVNKEYPFVDLEKFINYSNDWLFGYFSYDLKNEIENLKSNNLDYQLFPSIHFFTPEIIIKVKRNTASILYDACFNQKEIDVLFNKICSIQVPILGVQSVKIKSRLSKKEYIDNVIAIKKHLQAGDIYEMNYCQEFYVDNLDLDPFLLFSKFNQISKAPFSSFYRVNEHFCLCASPERYLRKTGSRIISQPIKGTIARLEDKCLDKKNKNILLNSSKDFSENVMIVDLVRNDLSRVAKIGTVNVDELSSLYTYRDVHHLISTISCELDEKYNIVDLIQASFPMGSMTGAPKIRSMELIEKYEKTLRGIYSGSIGYISPLKNFDFNVVIRSVFYNQQSQYLSFMVGGAITIDSDPELEYEECLLKAKSIFKLLNTCN